MKYPLAYKKKYGGPLLCGEFGCLRKAGKGVSQNLWVEAVKDVLNEEGIDWCFHTHSFDPNNVFKVSDTQFRTLWK